MQTSRLPLHLAPLEWFRSVLAPLTSHFKEVLAVSFFTNILALAVPIFTLQVYDRVVSHNSVSTLTALALGVIFALSFDYLLRQARSRMLQDVALQIDAALGRRLYEKIGSLPLKVLESKTSSYWQSLYGDVATVRTVFSGSTAVLVADIPFAIIFVLVICIIAMPVAWVLLVVIPAFLALTYYSTRAVNIATATETRKGQTRDGMLAEQLSGRATVKALNIAPAMQPQFEKLHAEHILNAYERGGKTDGFVALSTALTMFTTISLVIVGALAIIHRDMTMGALVATNMLAGRIVQPLNQLVSSWKSFASCRHSLVRLGDLFAQESERTSSGLTRERPQGRITIDNATFGYHENRPPVLKDVTLDILPNEMIGMIGRNGCGKTTLVKLMQGLYTPEQGRVLLDGGDIAQFTRAELTSWMGYVPQECILFSGSIRENIAKAHPDASDEQILQAARLADADGFIVDMPDGYNTQVGEAGSRLSGGQRQRIAIARALLMNPPVLLFDEISSNLDHQTEFALRETLLKLAQTHTIVLVTHSMALLRICHKLVVMDQGRVILAGPAADVLPRITGNAQNVSSLAEKRA